MGMFDYVNYGDLTPLIEKVLDEKASEERSLGKNLPSSLISKEGAQTKSLDNCLQMFTFRKDHLPDRYQLFVGYSMGIWEDGNVDEQDFIFCGDVTSNLKVHDHVLGDEWDVWYEVEILVVEGIAQTNKIRVTEFRTTPAQPRIEREAEIWKMIKESGEYRATLKGKLHSQWNAFRRRIGRKITELGNYIQWGPTKKS